MANLSLVVPVLFLALFVQDGDSVRCWSCSSALNPNCNDPFLIGQSGRDNYYPTNYAYALKLENCDAKTGATYPYLTSACKKQESYINGQLITSRGCTWNRTDACPNAPGEVITLCEICEFDGCNNSVT